MYGIPRNRGGLVSPAQYRQIYWNRRKNTQFQINKTSAKIAESANICEFSIIINPENDVIRQAHKVICKVNLQNWRYWQIRRYSHWVYFS
jgi:hypothetical protein